jgi:hypothetical protein
MWKEPRLSNQYLPSYLQDANVEKVIIIDNDPQSRPKLPEGAELISYVRNIFVNRAWNEGYFRSSSDVICLLNDDIFLPPDVIEYVSNLDWGSIDIIGTNPNHTGPSIQLTLSPVSKQQPIGSQFFGFGVCMFIARNKYKLIPSLYQIWFGDDYLVQNCNKVYRIGWKNMQMQMSTTVNSRNPNIDSRIILDTENAHRYLFGNPPIG